MAKRATSLLRILFLITFALYLQLSVSYNNHATTILDVSASIQKTLDVLSFKPKEKPLSESSLASPSATSPLSLSLSLFPRSSIRYSHFNNYESLVLSRLDRDSARVKSIVSRIDSLEAMSSSKSLTAPIISGVSQGSGEYFARIGIGQPVKSYYWIIDTGSDVSWLQCLPCDSCYQQSDPIYNPSTSSTYRSLSCTSTQCQSLDNPICFSRSCQYEVNYGDGSFTTGDLATDTLSFGLSGSANNVAIGCGHDNEGVFVAAAGIIGLGGGTLSLPSQLKADSFSYCLVDRDSTGSSTLEFNSGRLINLVTTTLVQNKRYATYRYLELIDMSVGGRRLNIPSSLFAVDSTGRGGTIIDSGTTITRLKTAAYNMLRNEFVRLTPNLRRTFGYQNIFDTCYYLSSGTISIPAVSFNFPRNQTLVLPAENILIPVNSGGKYCFAFTGTDSSLSIIGNVQQQTIRVNFDLVNHVVQFSPKQC